MEKRKLSKIDNFEIEFFTESDNYLPKEIDTPLYHYTSAESLNNIITGSCVELWASQINCLNDKDEVIHVEKIYAKVCDDLFNSQKIDSKFYRIIKKIKPPQEIYISYYQDLPDGVEIFGKSSIQKYTKVPGTRYISCFSTEKDSLPMWNYYSKGSRYEGYNIGIDYLNLKYHIYSLSGTGIDIKLIPVIYDDSKKEAFISGLLLKLYEAKSFKGATPYIEEVIGDFLSYYSICFKNNCFSHEKEVRVVLSLPNDPLPCAINQKDYKIDYRVKDGFFIPYTVMEFPQNLVSSIMIGPLTFSDDVIDNQKEILAKMLKAKGYENFDIDHSNIRIRY